MFILNMEKFLQLIKDSGSKITKPRKEVLSVLWENPKPVSLKVIHQKCSGIDFASVFRSINLFLDLEIVERINFGNKITLYELNRGKHHHHVICNVCGKIDRLDLCLLNNIEKMTNYQITEHSIEFVGICPDCLK